MKAIADAGHKKVYNINTAFVATISSDKQAHSYMHCIPYSFMIDVYAYACMHGGGTCQYEH